MDAVESVFKSMTVNKETEVKGAEKNCPILPALLVKVSNDPNGNCSEDETTQASSKADLDEIRQEVGIIVDDMVYATNYNTYNKVHCAIQRTSYGIGAFRNLFDDNTNKLIDSKDYDMKIEVEKCGERFEKSITIDSSHFSEVSLSDEKTSTVKFLKEFINSLRNFTVLHKTMKYTINGPKVYLRCFTTAVAYRQYM